MLMVRPVMETTMIAELEDMGIPQEVARRAAVRHPGDLGMAASWAWEVLSSPNRRPRQRARPSDHCGEGSLRAQHDSVQAAGEFSESAATSIQPRFDSIAQWCFAGPPTSPVEDTRNSWILVPLLLDASEKLGLSAQTAWRTHPVAGGSEE